MLTVIVPFRVRPSLLAATLASLALGLSACSKSKEPEPPTPLEIMTSNAPAVAPTPASKPTVLPRAAITNATSASATNLPAIPATNPAPATASAATPEQIQRLATLKTTYQAAQSFDDRFDVVIAIGKVGNAAAIQMLEQLFRTEKNHELRTELINALIEIGDCKDEKLSLLRLGITADQAPATREAAMDGLVDLDDARSLPLLKELATDPDEQIRTVAQQNLALLTEMLKAP